MFRLTRLKLTAWYLVIIMSVSILFSLAIFYILNNEINDSYQRIAHRYFQDNAFFLPNQNVPELDFSYWDESKERIKLELIYINLFILAVSASAGYFLAGRTLNPIQKMLDEQNRFISDASHELRTPLTTLITGIEVNLRDKDLKMSQAKELLQSNLEEVNGLKYLTDNLLILANDKNQNVLSKVSLKQLADQSLEKVGKIAKTKQIKLETNVPDIHINGNLDELTRVLVIFLDNAIKYSPKQSVVKLDILDSDKKVLIKIKDHGMGIESADIPHIFDRFFRADKSRSQTSGYGLGLSIAQKIISKYKGSIEVESKVGTGTTFTITLPKS